MPKSITVVLQEALLALGLHSTTFVVARPTDARTNADYYSNIALTCAAAAGDTPRTIATKIVAHIEGQLPDVARIEVAGPGFLNFYLARTYYTQTIMRARGEADSWGTNDTYHGAEVLIEYTSPNLFKPLHIGNLVGNIIGESLTRLFEMSGATVHRINYPSDIGPTVAKAVWGIKKTGGNASDIVALGHAYRVGSEAFDTDPHAKEEIEVINQALYAGSDDALVAIRVEGITTSKKHLDRICAKLGTKFEAEIFESEAGPIGAALVRENIGTIFTKSQGAVVYEGERVGLHTRVFLNSKGLPTYEAKDLGNFIRKHTLYPNWTHSIIVTASEQKEYFKVLYAAIKELFPVTHSRTLEHVPTGFLSLTTGKMSSRAGNVLTGESLLEEMEAAAAEKAAHTRADDIMALTEEVAVAALKYQILRQSVGSDIVFDKEKSLSFEGDSGPYLQYTHARTCSVLERARVHGVLPDTTNSPDIAYPIEILLPRFPVIVEEALRGRAPHVLVQYLIELASAFNTMYAQEKIADPTDVFAPYKAAITDTVRITLNNGLWALGIPAPERM
jgi:arginyl-tRNA synthetase